jgi:hypothetical protein
MSEYLNLFLPGQGIDELFVSLWTDEAIRLFLQRCILADEIFFPEGQSFSLAAFRTDSTHETGTGRYLKLGGTIQVVQETGTLKGLWNRLGLSSSQEEQVTPASSDQTSPGAESLPSPSQQGPLPKVADGAEEEVDGKPRWNRAR